jgi:hypothetical protein
MGEGRGVGYGGVERDMGFGWGDMVWSLIEDSPWVIILLPGPKLKFPFVSLALFGLIPYDYLSDWGSLLIADLLLELVDALKEC